MESLRKRLFRSSNLLVLSIIVAVAGFFVVFLAASSRFELARRHEVVKVYYADNISPAHRQVIERFNAAHSGRIEVVAINLPFSKFSTNERKELLARALRSKNGRVDIFAVDLIWVPRFARWAEPLDAFVAGNGELDFLPDALESCYVDSKLVALPLYLDIGMMYYQRDLLRAAFPRRFEALERSLKASMTWEAFIELHRQRAANATPFYLFAADNFEGLVCSFMELLLSQNPHFFDGDFIQLNSPEGRKALRLLVDIVHTYRLAPPDVTEFDEYKTYMYALNKNGLFWRGWPGLPVHYKDLPAFQGRLQHIGIAALPHFAGGRPVSVFGGWNLMIARNSAHKREALAFVEFFMEKENQILMFEQGGYIPTSKEVYADSLYVQRHPQLAYYHELISRGVHRPYRVDYTKISDVISFYIWQAIRQDISIPEALQAATDAINSDKVLIK